MTEYGLSDGMYCVAVILAAGKGTRMGGDVPKQYLVINDRPVLAHTLKAFEESRADGIVIVCSEGDEDYIRREIVDRYGFTKVTGIVTGGRERIDSGKRGVMKALEGQNTEDKIYKDKTRDNTVILIHDGARPCVRPELINTIIDEVRSGRRAVVPGVDSSDTVRIVGADGFATMTPSRKSVRRIQTPQGFLAATLMEGIRGYEADERTDASDITDDAMLVEKYTDERVYIVEGSNDNIKLTTPEDIARAEELLSQ